MCVSFVLQTAFGPSTIDEWLWKPQPILNIADGFLCALVHWNHNVHSGLHDFTQQRGKLWHSHGGAKRRGSRAPGGWLNVQVLCLKDSAHLQRFSLSSSLHSFPLPFLVLSHILSLLAQFMTHSLPSPNTSVVLLIIFLTSLFIFFSSNFHV